MVKDWTFINKAYDLIKSIHLLDKYTDYEAQVKALSKKLHKMLKDIEINKRTGAKHLFKIKYYPSGLCEYKSSRWETYKVALEPFEYIPKEKKITAAGPRKKSASLEFLKERDPLSYFVLKKKLGKKYDLSDYKGLPIAQGIEIIDKYESLESEKEKQEFFDAFIEMNRSNDVVVAYRTVYVKGKDIAYFNGGEFRKKDPLDHKMVITKIVMNTRKGPSNWRWNLFNIEYYNEFVVHCLSIYRDEMFSKIMEAIHDYKLEQPKESFNYWSRYIKNISYYKQTVELYRETRKKLDYGGYYMLDRELNLSEIHDLIDTNVRDKESREILFEIGILKDAKLPEIMEEIPEIIDVGVIENVEYVLGQ